MSSVLRLSQPEAHFQAALVAIKTRQARVAVMGLGYVGLPLVRLFWKSGFTVVGCDCDSSKTEQLNAGKSYIKHIPTAQVAEMRGSDRFHATTDMEALSEAQAIVICVPTPLTEHKEPDMSYVVQTAQQIRDHLTPG